MTPEPPSYTPETNQEIREAMAIGITIQIWAQDSETGKWVWADHPKPQLLREFYHYRIKPLFA